MKKNKSSKPNNNKAKIVTKKVVFEPQNQTENEPLVKSQKLPSMYLGLGLLIAVLVTGLFAFRSLFIAAIINGQPVSRLSVVRELEQQAGKQILESIVTKKLIEQEAMKQKINIDQKVIDTEFKKVETQVKSQGQNFDQLLALQGLNRKTFMDQIKMQKIIELMFQKNSKVTDKEIEDYVTKNQETLGENIDTKQIKTQLEQEKLRTAFQVWLTKTKKDSKITYFVQY